MKELYGVKNWKEPIKTGDAWIYNIYTLRSEKKWC